MNKNNLIQWLLLEEEDDDIYLQFLFDQPTKNSPYPLYKTRKSEGYHHILFNGHLQHDEKKFREFFRLNRGQFKYILDLIKEDVTTASTTFVPKPISPEEKLAVTLRFLASGESYRSLSFQFRISHSYISKIIKTTLKTMKKYLLPIFLPSPTEQMLKEKSIEFWNKWQFPNVVAAVDGKHIRMKCPKNTGSLFFNYKEYFSLVLLAFVDANCKFVVIDVGSYGKEGDSGIFAKTKIGQSILEGSFNFPKDNYLPGTHVVTPHVIVGDEAFRLHRNIMKPYSRGSIKGDRSKTIFNYRLSRCRRVTENAFGLLSQVFRVFYSPIAVDPEVCDDLVVVTCCLHNLLRDAFLEKNGKSYYELDSTQPAAVFNNLSRSGGYANAEGLYVRDKFKQYFVQEGQVSWQTHQISRTSSI